MSRWDINRKNVIGKHLCYWLRKAKVIVIDYGNKNGDIHLYKYQGTTSSENLKAVIDEFVGNNDLASKTYLNITELKDDDSLFNKIFTYQSKQNNNVEKEEEKNDKNKIIE